MTVECKIVDYSNSQQCNDLLNLLQNYAQDPMGGGKRLPSQTTDRLISELSKREHIFSIIAYCNNKPAGFANCIEGFSTFKCAPLLNIHDFGVNPNFRNQGISRHLLTKIEEIAHNKNCCKITLEVLQGNTIAKNIYFKFGFTNYELDPEMGHALFLEKSISLS